MKYNLHIIFLAIFFSLFFPSTSYASCKLTDETTLKIKGWVDQKLLDCVTALDLENVKIVEVNSGGGRVSMAMSIGDLLAPLKPHIRIDKRCNSSCANYWLPLASKITLKKNAVIILHGSMDPATYRRTLVQEKNGVSEEQKISLWNLFSMQHEYAVNHKIHRGWLMYRENYPLKETEMDSYLSGRIHAGDELGPTKFVLVEEKMLRTCLSDVEITPYHNTSTIKLRGNEKKRLKKRRKGFSLSGSWACFGPDSSAYPAPTRPLAN